jgi:hypothetical protein
VKNLGLYIDNRLSWRKQISRFVSRTYFTLWLFYRFQRYVSRDLRINFVRSLIIPIFLYTDVIYFFSLTGLEFRRLELTFNACTMYVFRLRCFDHISEFSGGIVGYTLLEYLELRLACFIHKIGLVGASSYFSSLLVLGRSKRQRFITMPCSDPSFILRGDSTVYRGLQLWNELPSTAKSCRGMSMFWREAGQFLSADVK